MIKKIFAIITAVLMLTCVFSACSCGGKKTEKTEQIESDEIKVSDIAGTWQKISDEKTEIIYVFKPDGTGYVQAYNLKFKLNIEISKGNYTLNINAASAYEEMFGMKIDEIIAANLIDEESLHITESGKISLSGEYILLMHDGVTDYLRKVED